jgi:hypothetical protein
VTPPRREDALVVFAQAADAHVAIDAWNAHAMRFFATRVGLTTDRRRAADEPVPRTDALAFVVSPDGEPAGVRRTLARPRDAGDLALAEEADARAGGTGLGLLARRCEMVWVVDREAQGDRLALRLAAILASILLGPIFDPGTRELFGVKTARAKLLSQITRS